LSYGSEGYLSHHRDNERVASMLRSIIQDGCNDFSKDTIEIIFKKKMVNDTDIGKVCVRWANKIDGSLKDEESAMRKLLLTLWMLYQEGINPDTDDIWHIIWLKDAVPLFAKKINEMPSTGKAASMASYNKPGKKRRDVSSVRW